jgi:pimeloyl-ACP methyl ester carboxylesterase
VETSNDRCAAPAVILLPGTLCDDRAMAPLIACLAGRAWRVVPSAGAETAAGVAGQFLAQAPPLFVLIGFSLGGMVALEIAAQAPSRVIGLTLIGSNARPDKPGAAAARRADVADARARGLSAMLLDHFWSRYVGAASRADMALQRVILAMAEAQGVDVFAQQVEMIISRADSRPLLPTLNMPVLVLAGSQDALCPPMLQEEMAAAAPNAKLAIIPDAGHFVLLEAPRQATRIVLAWLEHLAEPYAHISKELLP